MEVRSPEDWIDGFMAAVALMAGHHNLYEERRDAYLRAKGGFLESLLPEEEL